MTLSCSSENRRSSQRAWKKPYYETQSNVWKISEPLGWIIQIIK